MGFQCPWWATKRLAAVEAAAAAEAEKKVAASSLFLAWLQAARPPCFFMLALPLLLGQAFGVRAQGAEGAGWSLPVAGLLFVILALHQCALLWLNDAADHTLDAGNTTFDSLPGIRVSGGSRVVQQGKVRSMDWSCVSLFVSLLD